MAVDLEKLKWALNQVDQIVTFVDENGIPTGDIGTVTNKSEPSVQFKNSGLLYDEPLPREFLNFFFNQVYLAIADLDARITALEP